MLNFPLQLVMTLVDSNHAAQVTPLRLTIAAMLLRLEKGQPTHLDVSTLRAGQRNEPVEGMFLSTEVHTLLDFVNELLPHVTSAVNITLSQFRTVAIMIPMISKEEDPAMSRDLQLYQSEQIRLENVLNLFTSKSIKEWYLYMPVIINFMLENQNVKTLKVNTVKLSEIQKQLRQAKGEVSAQSLQAIVDNDGLTLQGVNKDMRLPLDYVKSLICKGSVSIDDENILCTRMDTIA